MNFRQKVASNIEKQIKYSGKSKVQVAKELGVAKNTISGYTSGRSLPDAENIQKLCQILDCLYEDIMGEING